MLHREWNPKLFFRNISPEPLAALLASRGVTLDGEGALWQQAYRAWKSEFYDRRRNVQELLLQINDLSTPHARPYLVELANSIWPAGETLSLLHDWSVCDMAVRLYLADSARFAETHRRYAFDLQEPLLQFHGTYPKAPEATEGRKAALKRAFPACMRIARIGTPCTVEDFSDSTKLVLHVFYENEVHVYDRFTDSGCLETSWSSPARHVVLVFYFATASLVIQGCRWVDAEKLSTLFARLYIEDASYFHDVLHKPCFSFDVLRDPRFSFPTKLVDQIEGVSLVRVVARHSQQGVRRVVVDLEPSLSLEAAHRTLAEHGVDMLVADIDSVQLEVRFHGIGRGRIRTVHLANPNTSNLRDTKRDRVIRSYLQEWGIDAALGCSLATSSFPA